MDINHVPAGYSRVLASYPQKLKIAKRKDLLMRAAETLALISPLISTGTTNGYLFWAGLGTFLLRACFTGSFKYNLDWSLAGTLSKEAALDEAAHALAKMDEPTRSRILAACNYAPLFPPLLRSDHLVGEDTAKYLPVSRLAKEIRGRLPAALQKMES